MSEKRVSLEESVQAFLVQTQFRNVSPAPDEIAENQLLRTQLATLHESLAAAEIAKAAAEKAVKEGEEKMKEGEEEMRMQAETLRVHEQTQKEKEEEVEKMAGLLKESEGRIEALAQESETKLAAVYAEKEKLMEENNKLRETLRRVEIGTLVPTLLQFSDSSKLRVEKNVLIHTGEKRFESCLIGPVFDRV